MRKRIGNGIIWYLQAFPYPDKACSDSIAYGQIQIPGGEGMDKRMTEQSIQRLLDVSIALSAERDREKFLSLALDTAISVADCDGGTLYLLEDGMLRFSRMRTISLKIRQDSQHDENALPPVPMDPRFVCAWAAIHRETVNIPDVRNSGSYDFSGALDYDRITGYHTVSMLVVPLMGNKGELAGVMQLINAVNWGRIIPFPAAVEQLVSALASQTAACIQNIQYAKQIDALLDSLVDAMTTAIDDRTPYNANHSRNMAKCAECFLDWAAENDPAWQWTADHRRAFLLSVKLHDVGKLVTPGSVMNKDSRLGNRLPFIEERFRRMNLLGRIAFLEGRLTQAEYLAREEENRAALDRIRQLNRAPYLTGEDIRWAGDLAGRSFQNEDGIPEPVVTQEERDCLQIRRGTLTDGEREKMQAHVTETRRILEQVRFPPEFRDVPVWADGHHELLDGTGYPDHLAADRIPAEIRLITILDIFDSLVADDRPYKKGKTPEEAFGILQSMAEEGKLDAELLRLYKASGAWEKTYRK